MERSPPRNIVLRFYYTSKLAFHSTFILNFAKRFIILFAYLGPFEICLMGDNRYFLDLPVIGMRAVPLGTLVAAHTGDSGLLQKIN
jgi:hypothetical protein